MEKVLYGLRFGNEIKGYYKVEFYDDDGNCLNHWLSFNQVQYFLDRKDAVKYIKEVKSWHAITFTQTLIVKIK